VYCFYLVSHAASAELAFREARCRASAPGERCLRSGRADSGRTVEVRQVIIDPTDDVRLSGPPQRLDDRYPA
jgi:hypothetical protein